MRPFKKIFSSPVLALLAMTLFVFIQLASAYILGAALDNKMDSPLLWIAPLIGFVAGSSLSVLSISQIAGKDDGFRFGRLSISSPFLLFYAMLAACFLGFVLFGSIFAAFRDSYINRTGWATIGLSIVCLVCDGLGFFAAMSMRGKTR